MSESRFRRTAVLVPYLGYIHPPCEQALQQLQQLGYTVRRLGGNASIDAARSQLATDALRDGFQWLMWIDSDIGFEPRDVQRLAAHELPAVAGIYAKKGRRELACHLLPTTDRLTLGEGGSLIEALYVGTGFLLTHREVYDTMARELKLPTCNQRFGQPVVPYFLPMIHEPEPGQPWYLSEDFAFCQRLRSVGYQLWVDTTIRLRHFGLYGYTWEDAGSSKVEYQSYQFHLR